MGERSCTDWEPSIRAQLEARLRACDATRRARLARQGTPTVERWVLGGQTFEARWLSMDTADATPAGALLVVVELTDAELTRQSLTWRIAFERLITELSTRFVSIAPDATDRELNHALRHIGEFCDVDRAYIFAFDADGRAMSNTHEWCAPDIEPQIGRLQHLPLEVFPWWVERIKHREVIRVTDVAAMPEVAKAEREILQEQGIRSIVVLPMVRESASVGFLGFDSVRARRTWSDEDVALLKIVGELFVGALARKQAHLQRLVLEAQLVQARSLDNVARLAGGVAHDFNNLMAVILNYAALLRKELDRGDLGNYAHELMDTAMQAAALTRQLLIVGRKGSWAPVPLDLNAVIGGMEGMLRRTVGEGFELELCLDPNLGFVRMAQPQVEQILVNLVLNARQAMRDGGHLRIETCSTVVDEREACRHIDLEAGPHVLLRVVDDGDGMSEDVVAHAFEPFFTTRGGAGTGLGLSTVLGIVKEAGGQILLESTPGRGTSVSIYLPDLGREVMLSAPSAQAESAPEGHGERILYVEDNAPLRCLAEKLLRDAHYEVTVARSPAEALEECAANERSFDLLLTDIVLPTMSGCELAELIRQRFGVTRMAYVSGYADDELSRRGAFERPAYLLQKPFLGGDLLRFVRAALDQLPLPSGGKSTG